MTLSRAWTNFHRRAERPNLEVYSDFYAGKCILTISLKATCFETHTSPYSICFLLQLGFNNVDPMYFPTTDGRDVFPKVGLDDKGNRGYIGDRVKLCTDMPTMSWLKKGARYIFRGSSPNLELGRSDPKAWDAYPDASRLVLDETSGSNLYSVLCNADHTGVCRYESTVILSEDIECTGTCTAGDHPDRTPVSGTYPCECSIDEPRTIRIDQPSSSGLPSSWFEYVKDECVNLAFQESGDMKAVSEIGNHWGEYGNEAVCVDQGLAIAGTVCCDVSGANPRNFCIYRGERTTYVRLLLFWNSLAN